MLTTSVVAAAVAAGLSFGIALPAQAADCTVDRVLVSAAVEGAPATYGDAPLLTEAQEAWIERMLVSPAVDEVSHVVHHEAVYAPRVVIDRPFVAAVPAVDEVSHIVRHPAVTETVHHDAVTKEVSHEAVTKVVHHDAVTKNVHHEAETKVVHHDAVTKNVHHEAETKVVHHDAVSATAYTRYSWVGGKQGPRDGSTPATAPKDWNADNKKYDGSKTNVVTQQGNGNGSYFYWWARDEVQTPAYDETVVVTPAWDETVVVTEAWDEKVVTPAWGEKVVVSEAWDERVVVTPASTETVVVTPAWDETVEVVPAWDEKVVVTEARPGTSEEPEISHVEYDLVTEAWDETIVDVAAQAAVYAEITHPAVSATFGEPALISPAIDAIPAVYEDVESCVSSAGPDESPLPADGETEGAGANAVQSAAVTELALTGGGVNPMLPIAATALLAGGIALLATRRSRRGDR